MELKGKSDDQKAEVVVRLLSDLKSIRADYETLWTDLIEFLALNRYNLDGFKQKGSRVGQSVYDGTPISALNILGDGLHGYLVSPAIKWFALRLARSISFSKGRANMRKWDGKRLDDIPEIKQWLEWKEEVMYSAFTRSNFYDSMAEYFRDGGGIGTATMYTEEDIRSGSLVFSCLHPGECYIGEDIFGRVDTVLRSFKLTARQAIQYFDSALLSTGLVDAAEKAPYTEFKFIHGVFPRSDSEIYMAPGGKVTRKLDNKNMPFASVYVQEDGKRLVKEGGFKINPFHVWRWRKNSEETYGRCPGGDALVDIISLQVLGKTMLNAAQLSVEPAYMVPKIMRGKTRITPRGMNYYDDPSEKIYPIMSGINYPIGGDRESQKRKIIEEHFKVEFFLMLARAERIMTATEILERQGEKAAILGSTIGRLTSECLNPIIDLVDQIEIDGGRMPEVPQILLDLAAGMPIEVDYMGPLAQAQRRLFRTQGVSYALEAMSPVALMKPEILDVVDFDEVIREILSVSGMPARCIRGKDIVIKLRQDRAAAMQQGQQMEQVERASAMLPQVGKAIEEGSPIQMMLNAAQGKGAPGLGGAPPMSGEIPAVRTIQ